MTEKLCGVILAGGKSSRMKRDKSMIDYFGKPQRFYLYDLLETICNTVFISVNSPQQVIEGNKYQYLIDKEPSNGPIEGLLAGFNAMPDHHMLLVGCDYPYMTKPALQKLTEAGMRNTFAVSYYNKELNLHEPMLALYKNICYPLLKQYVQQNKHSLSGFLKSIDHISIDPESELIIKSANTEEDYLIAKDYLRKKVKG